MEQIINAIAQWFYNLLFTVLMWFKDVFDMCYILVRKLAGIDTYYYNGQAMGTGAADSGTVTGDIIEVLIRSDIVQNLFLTLLVLGIILLIIVTFIAVWKTEWEFGKDGNSKSKVINAALKALFNFIAVPVITFFGIFVGNALLRAIDDATSGGENVKMSDIVLTSIATNALRADHQGETFNYELINLNNTVNAETGQVGLYQYFMNSKGEIVTNDILTAFKNNSTIKTSGVYYVDATGMGMDVLGVNQKLENGTLVFTFDDEQVVNVFFDKGKFNYVLGYLVLIIMLKTMLEITFGLVKRLFYLVFLFIVSPPIVAMAPVNDKSLPKWREAFIKNAGSAFVTIGIYNIFLSIYPLFDRISLFGSSDRVLFGIFPLSLLNGFVSLLFVCVGLLVVNQISKAISEMFGVHDLYDQSTEKGKSLWGDAFGLAGKALKPLTLPAKVVGKGTEYVSSAFVNGPKDTFKRMGKDLLGGAGKMANAGPLAEMWKNAGVKDVANQYSKIKKDFGEDYKAAWDIGKSRRATKKMLKNEMKENEGALQNSSVKQFNDSKSVQAGYLAKMKTMGKETAQLAKKYKNSSDNDIRQQLGKKEAEKVIEYKKLLQKVQDENKNIRAAKEKAKKDNTQFTGDYIKTIKYNRAQQQLDELKSAKAFKILRARKNNKINEDVENAERIIARQTAKADAQAKAGSGSGSNDSIEKKLDKIEDLIKHQNKKR